MPDERTRGRLEQLVFEMDDSGVDQAVIIGARIDRNPDNDRYIVKESARFEGRFYPFPDVDCHWTSTYHTPGAADRLRRVADRWPIRGFGHYVLPDNDRWFVSGDGQRFFAVAAERDLIVSISSTVDWQSDIRFVAERFPSLQIICNHLAGLRLGPRGGVVGLKALLPSARLPNILIKISGISNLARRTWDYPYPETAPVVRAIYEHFGADRMCWGSDYPPVLRSMTYRQSLEAFRSHCDFVDADDQRLVLGETLHRVLTPGRA